MKILVQLLVICFYNCENLLKLNVNYVEAATTTQRNVFKQNRQNNYKITTQLLSPCPDVFSYISVNNTSNGWTGVLHLTTTVQLYGIYIDLIFDRRVSLVTINDYNVTTSNNFEFHLENRSIRLEPGLANRHNLLLNIYYNNDYVPKLKDILLNGQNICHSNDDFVIDNISVNNANRRTSTTSRNSTLLPLSTTEYYVEHGGDRNNDNFDTERETYDRNNNNNHKNPLQHQFNSKNSENGDQVTTKRTLIPSRITSKTPLFFEGDFDFIQSGQTTKTIIPPVVNTCGTIIPKTNPLILTGEIAYNGQFPWHAALYLSKGIILKYICGGTLISKKIILTAAHCVAHEGTTQSIDPNNLLIYLGKFYLSKWQRQEQDVKVSDIIINPDYDNNRLYSDIAIIRLINEPKFNDFIRPICLWNMNTDLKLMINKVGTIPGWSIDSSGIINDVLSFVKMPIVSHETCIWSNRDFFSQITSERSFCAGFKNDSSVCNGDSGSGMIFHLNNKYYLRGIVSVSIALQNHSKCDPQHYVVFTDVSKFLQWIEEYL